MVGYRTSSFFIYKYNKNKTKNNNKTTLEGVMFALPGIVWPESTQVLSLLWSLQHEGCFPRLYCHGVSCPKALGYLSSSVPQIRLVLCSYSLQNKGQMMQSQRWMGQDSHVFTELVHYKARTQKGLLEWMSNLNLSLWMGERWISVESATFPPYSHPQPLLISLGPFTPLTLPKV